MKERKGFHYGWVIVACGILVMAVTHGVVANCFSLYLRPVTEELGLSRQSFSTCQMIVNLLYMGISLLSGKIYARVKPHTLMKVAAFTLPAGYFAYSLCSTLPQFYAVSAVVGVSVAFLTFLPFTLILTDWFEQRRGLAIGLCFMGSGLGGMLFNSLAGQWVTTIGWRSTFTTLSIIMAAVLVPVIFLVLKPAPEAMDMEPYGGRSAGTQAGAVYGLSLKEALHGRSFYLLVLLALMIGMTTTMLGNTIIPHLTDLGFDAGYASKVMSAYMGGLAVCKVLLGTVTDKLGARKGTLLSLLAVLLGLVGLYFAQYQPSHVLIVIGAALGCASCTVSYPLLTRFAFGSAAYATLYGVINAANSLTTSLAPVVTNVLFDRTGSYNTALLGGLALCVVSLLLLPFLKGVKEPQA